MKVKIYINRFKEIIIDVKKITILLFQTMYYSYIIKIL